MILPNVISYSSSDVNVSIKSPVYAQTVVPDLRYTPNDDPIPVGLLSPSLSYEDLDDSHGDNGDDEEEENSTPPEPPAEPTEETLPAVPTPPSGALTT